MKTIKKMSLNRETLRNLDAPFAGGPIENGKGSSTLLCTQVLIAV
jgi:hypothetical protein